MARIRTVKPEFWQSPQAARCSRDARLCFIGLLNECDDEGRMRWAPKRLAGVLFPSDDDVGVAQITAWVGELEAAKDDDGHGLVARYAVGADEFLCVPKFLRHQRISKPQVSTLPPPPFAVERTGRGASEDESRGERNGSGKEGSSGRGATDCPSPFPIGDDLRAWASERAPHVDLTAEAEKLVNWSKSKGVRRKDWPATFRNWLFKAEEDWSKRNPSGAAPRPQPKTIGTCNTCGELTVDCRC